MQSIKNMYVFLLLLLPATWMSCGRDQQQEAAATQTAAPSANQVVLNKEQLDLAGIEVGVPELRMMSAFIECTGKIEVPPENLVLVHTPVKGFIKEVRHLPGSYVRKGERLTAIAHPDLIRLQREFLETAGKLEALEKDYQRKQSLANAEAASQRSLEQAKSEFEIAQAHYRGLKTEMKLIGVDVNRLEKERQMQEQIVLFSPVNGYINEVRINPGKLVNSEDLLFEILDVSHVHAELKVFSKDAGSLREGQRIEVKVPGTEKRFFAEVHLFSRMVDEESKTVMIHGHFEKEPVDLFPGTFIHARIFTKERKVLAVPETAVVRTGNEAFVFVKKGEAFEKVKVSTGVDDGQYVELLDWSETGPMALAGAHYLNGALKATEE